MAKGLHRLVYVSQNRETGTPEGLEAAIRSILETSRRRNAEAGITGSLVFNDGIFGQVLEGPLGAVEATFERIQQDERHGDVTLLDVAPVPARSFGNWSMAFLGASPELMARFGHIAAATGFTASSLAGERLHQVLVGLVWQEERHVA